MTTSNTHISRRRGPSDRLAGLDVAASQQGAEAVQGEGLKSKESSQWIQQICFLLNGRLKNTADEIHARFSNIHICS